MSGVIVGGWSYVVTAYVVTVVVLAAYTASVLLRLRAERRKAARARVPR
jgi:hypothetical protein